MQIESLYRYPVKGLTPEPIGSANLAPSKCIPWDRAFALAQGDADFNPAQPAWLAKTNFMCLLRNAGIALLKSSFDDASGLLTIAAPNGEVLQADPLTPEGQNLFTDFLTDYLGDEARIAARRPRFTHAAGHSFCDHKTQVVSLIGLGSLRALEQAAEGVRDKRRFRANIYIDNIEPWAEFSWLGKILAIGDATLIVQERIDRCGATTVNPDTAERDANPVKELQKNFGHVDLGIFAEVVTGGTIKPGDEIRVL
jgi:uncharacterized protein YcbX